MTAATPTDGSTLWPSVRAIDAQDAAGIEARRNYPYLVPEHANTELCFARRNQIHAWKGCWRLPRHRSKSESSANSSCMHSTYAPVRQVVSKDRSDARIRAGAVKTLLEAQSARRSSMRHIFWPKTAGRCGMRAGRATGPSAVVSRFRRYSCAVCA